MTTRAVFEDTPGVVESKSLMRELADADTAEQMKAHDAAHCVVDVKPALSLLADDGVPAKRPYLRAGEVAAVKPVIDAIQDAEHAMFMFRKLWGMNQRVPREQRQYPTLMLTLREAEDAIARLNEALDAEQRGVTPTFDEIVDMDFGGMTNKAA